MVDARRQTVGPAVLAVGNTSGCLEFHVSKRHVANLGHVFADLASRSSAKMTGNRDHLEEGVKARRHNLCLFACLYCSQTNLSATRLTGTHNDSKPAFHPTPSNMSSGSVVRALPLGNLSGRIGREGEYLVLAAWKNTVLAWLPPLGAS